VKDALLDDNSFDLVPCDPLGHGPRRFDLESLREEAYRAHPRDRLAARHFSRHSIGDQTRDLVAHLRQLM
jgi:hypothetical protein